MLNTKVMVPLSKKITTKIIIIACALVCVCSCVSFDNEGAGGGRIDLIAGMVTVDGKNAAINQRLTNNNVIRTGTKSSCDIVFGGRNIIRLGENTELVFTYKPSDLRLKLNTGEISSVLKDLAKALDLRKSFMVETPTAVIGVRGTVFFVRSENLQNTYICACNGTIETDNIIFSDKKQLQSNHHLAIRISREGETFSRIVAPLLYHNDITMQAVADRIGYKIDWKTSLEKTGY